MKKSFLLVFLLLIPFAQAIAVAVPKEREIFFEPDKTAFLEYAVSNPDAIPLNVEIIVGAGPLAQLFDETKKLVTVAPFSSQPIAFQLRFPSSMNGGLYPITVDISEVALAGGMSGVTGVRDIINIISPFEEGYPYVKVDVGTNQKAGEPITFAVLVQNIGKKPLQNKALPVNLLLNGEAKKDAVIQIPPLDAFAKTRIKSTFPSEGLPYGTYVVKAIYAPQESEQETVYGQPVITVTDVPKLKAAEINEFTAKVTLDNWQSVIPDALVRFRVTNLINLPQKITLSPGENLVKISAQAKQGKTGTYPGSVELIGKNIRATGSFSTEVEGSAMTGGIGFKKNPQKQEPTEVEEQPEQLAPETKEQKSKIFLLILLVASFAIFAFALGQFMGRRKNEPKATQNVPQITPVQPPKPQ
jgi:hypothetical protein